MKKLFTRSNTKAPVFTTPGQFQHRKTALICDDSSFMRRLIRRTLEKNNMVIIGEAENGAMAVQKYFELMPNVVTMDITMQHKDGLEALREITLRDPNANVFMLSAMGQDTLLQEAMNLGARGFIIKPFKEPALIEKINAALGVIS